MAFQSEEDLEKSAVSFLNESFFAYSWQVPLYNRIIDLVAIDNEGKLVGIEFKLRDWKRAINQALANSNSFDFIYVCLPGGRYLSRLKDMAEKHGIGVMIYDPKINTIRIEMNARKINRQWKPNVQYLRNFINSKGGN